MMDHEEHAHLHEHEPTHAHGDEHPHGAKHPHHHDMASASPRDELVALMKYMVGHNASHIDELAGLARQLDTIGEADAHDRIRHAIELFRHGNEQLAEALKDLQ